MLQTQQEVIILILTITFLFIAIAIIFLVMLVYYRNNKRKILQEKEQLKKDFEAQTLQSQLEIQEQTFAAISEEIHDNVGQILSLAKMQLNIASIKENNLPTTVVDATNNISRAMADLRDVAKSINTEKLTKQTLLENISAEIHRLQKLHTLQIQLTVEGQELEMDGKRKLMVYRVIQESFNNIIKHAQASTVNVIIHFKPQNVFISIQDNGIGFNNNEKQDGLGLQNIYKRMLLIGGNAFIQSQPNKGTTTQLKFPYA